MPATSLIDLAPLGRMLPWVMVLAALPLAWVAWRARHRDRKARRHALTLAAVFLTFDLVVFGAFTRLTDSGLGCPDWPGCYGQANPLEAAHPIAQAELAMPDGPVTTTKAWIEMIHRYLASVVGALILVLAVSDGVARRRAKIPLSPWPWVTLVWVGLQGAFGAWTVTWKLQPLIVSAHLLGGMVLLALLGVQAVASGPPAHGRGDPARRRGWGGLAVLALVLLQVALGAWVSTNYAVLACADFPTCQGAWWPAMDFQHGFTLWRDLGVTANGAPLPFAALTAIHMVHRLLALLVWLALMVTALRWWSADSGRGPAMVLAVLACLQVASGIGNVVLGWPMLVALAHTGGAALLVLVLARRWVSRAGVRA